MDALADIQMNLFPVTDFTWYNYVNCNCGEIHKMPYRKYIQELNKGRSQILQELTTNEKGSIEYQELDLIRNNAHVVTITASITKDSVEFVRGKDRPVNHTDTWAEEETIMPRSIQVIDEQ